MTIIDLTFPVFSSQPIPADHGYALYAGLSRKLPVLHQQNGIGIHPLRGRQVGDRMLALNDRSRLAIRMRAEEIGGLIQLAGKSIDVAGHALRIGVPQVYALRPTTAVRSRLVTIKLKDGLTEQAFMDAARRQMRDLALSDEVCLTLGKRRTLRIKDKEVVGYEVLVEALTADESLILQESGLGGRRHMGCGVFAATIARGAR